MNPGKKIPNDANIFLIGFMGAGKSTVGKLLAERLNREFFDTDLLIESEKNLPVHEIFTSKGEAYFRKLESEIIKCISIGSRKIIAVGGGAVISDKNWECISGSGITVYLQWHPQLLVARICKDLTRPLIVAVEETERTDYLLNLLDNRRRYYERADFMIENSPEDDPVDTLTKITKLFEETL